LATTGRHAAQLPNCHQVPDMQISIANVLTSEQVTALQSELTSVTFDDGRMTAGWAAALVKNNQQAIEDIRIETLLEDIVTRVVANPVFKTAVQPKRISKALISRYRLGNEYGRHVDNPLMDGDRTDVSFTLFLSDPASYDGGELVLQTPGGEETVKLPGGSLFAYPSTTLHKVTEVTRGERLALVGWVRSHIRSAEQRELLFDLETARLALFERHGKTQEFDLLSKTAANLMRMWVDD
jgi:PKHD-type hydroxylase